MLVGTVCLIGRVATAAPIGGAVVSIVSPGDGTEGPMLRQRSSHLDPARTGDEGRRRPERARGVSSRHRRHRPGVECLEDRRLLSAITVFPLPTADFGSAIPHAGDLTVGPDGNLWFPERSSGRSRLGPSARPDFMPSVGSRRMGALTEFPLPTAYTLEPYNLALTVGPDGNLWFTEGSLAGPAIGRITPAGAITEFPLPTARWRRRPDASAPTATSGSPKDWRPGPRSPGPRRWEAPSPTSRSRQAA